MTIQRVSLEVVQVARDDCIDFMRFCVRHRWASVPYHNLDHLGQCPFCRVELDERRGRERFDSLQRQLIALYPETLP